MRRELEMQIFITRQSKQGIGCGIGGTALQFWPRKVVEQHDGFGESVQQGFQLRQPIGTQLQPVIAEAEALVPRGGVDLALAYHHLGDAQMVTALQVRDLQSMRFRDRVTLAVRLRLTDADPTEGGISSGLGLSLGAGPAGRS